MSNNYIENNYVKRVTIFSSLCIRIRSNTVLSGQYVKLMFYCENRQLSAYKVTLHKTLVTDWLTYVQNILQPSFAGPFDVV